jgi:hypothetical protein
VRFSSPRIAEFEPIPGAVVMLEDMLLLLLLMAMLLLMARLLLLARTL